jgi:hypothetical protein
MTLIQLCERILSFVLFVSKIVYVSSGISYSTDEFGLREAFSKYGEVVDGN